MERVGVYIGRFQPFHKGHEDVIAQMVNKVDRIIILIGSSHSSLDPKNPFTWKERSYMIGEYIHTTYPEVSVNIFPIADYTRDIDWEKQVQTVVSNCSKESSEIHLFGYLKDQTSYYLQKFPQWKLNIINKYRDINATDIRKQLFEEGQLDSTLLPESTQKMVELWKTSPVYGALVKEYLFYRDYKKRYEGLKDPVTFTTVDAVILDHTNKVLMIKRKDFPGKGYWSLPGGFLGQDETLVQSVIRTVEKKTQIILSESMVYANRVIDNPNRSLRGRTVTHVFLFKLPKGFITPPNLSWFNINQLFLYEEQIFEDHKRIIEDFAS